MFLKAFFFPLDPDICVLSGRVTLPMPCDVLHLLLVLFIAFDSQEVQYLTDILKNCFILPDFPPI